MGKAGSDFGVGRTPCDQFGRGKTGLCVAHSALVQDRCVHCGGTIRHTMIKFLTVIKNENMIEVVPERYDLLKSAVGKEAFTGWRGPNVTESMQMKTHSRSESILTPRGRERGSSDAGGCGLSVGAPTGLFGPKN